MSKSTCTIPQGATFQSGKKSIRQLANHKILQTGVGFAIILSINAVKLAQRCTWLTGNRPYIQYNLGNYFQLLAFSFITNIKDPVYQWTSYKNKQKYHGIRKHQKTKNWQKGFGS